MRIWEKNKLCVGKGPTTFRQMETKSPTIPILDIIYFLVCNFVNIKFVYSWLPKFYQTISIVIQAPLKLYLSPLLVLNTYKITQKRTLNERPLASSRGCEKSIWPKGFDLSLISWHSMSNVCVWEWKCDWRKSCAVERWNNSFIREIQIT